MMAKTKTFKQFLDEGRGVPKSVDQFIEWADKNCSEYMNGKVHLFRGFTSGSSPILIGNSVGEKPRKSVGDIPNNYTLWIDNHPRFKGFPKRSRSFIASTSTSKAQDFGKPYMMFCPDDVKIAQVLDADIWVRKLLPNVMLLDLNEATEKMLKKYSLDKNDKYFQLQNSLQHISIKRVREFVDDEDIEYFSRKIARHILEKMEEAGWHDLYDFWDNMVKPSLFEVTDGANLSKQTGSVLGEVWIEGTCGFISMRPEGMEQEDKDKLAEWLNDKNPDMAKTLTNMWKRFDDLQKELDAMKDEF